MYVKYCDVNNLYDWVMSPLNDFKWVENISEFNEDFVKRYNDKHDKGNFLEDDVQYPENLHNLHKDLPFFRKRMKFNQKS